MLPQLLFGPVPYEPSASLPEHSPDGAGTGFEDLIRDIENSSQVAVNKENNLSVSLPDDSGNVDFAQVPVVSAESYPLQDPLPLTDSDQVVEVPDRPVMNSLPAEQRKPGAPAISGLMVGNRLPAAESAMGISTRADLLQDQLPLTDSDQVVEALDTVPDRTVINSLSAQQRKPADPAISGPMAGNRLPAAEPAMAISARAVLLEDPGAPGISTRYHDAPRPGGPPIVPDSSPDPLQQTGLVPSRLAAPTAMQAALAAQTRAADPAPQGQAVRFDSSLTDGSGSPAQISLTAAAPKQSVPMVSPAYRAPIDIASGPEARPVSTGSTLAQVAVDELPAAGINKAMKSASTGLHQAIDRDDRGNTIQRATDAVQSAAQLQPSINTPRQTAVDPLAAGSALMAAGANVSEQRLSGRSSLATRMTNLSATAGAVAGDAVVKPESTPAGGSLQMPSDGAQKTADAGDVPQRIQTTLTSAERAAGASHERLERRQNEFAALTTSVSAETTRPESAVLRTESSAQSAQIPAQLARHILNSHTQNLSELRMQLKPEELGQLDLKLRVEGERVHVVIVTQQPGVRELLESQLPQLRSLLQEGGFQLGDVDVRQDSGKSGDSPADQTPDGGSLVADLPDGTDGSVPADNRDNSAGLIDAFV